MPILFLVACAAVMAIAPEAAPEHVSAPTLAEPDVRDDIYDAADRWMLHDIIQDAHVAATPSWRADIAVQPRQRRGPTSWQRDVARARERGTLWGLPEQHHRIDRAAVAFDIPLADHPLVDLYIDYFTGRGRLMFERWLVRAARLAPIMQRILADRHIPQDLVYVAMVESGFAAGATSPAHATGFWQFMPATAKLFGLQHDVWIDERRDFIAATGAAATYLAQLHRALGDWHLAWASYNAGEGRIRRAMAKYGAQSFWALIDHPHSVSQETMHYVPKIIAAAQVAKEAKRYGFNLPEIEPVDFDEVAVEGAIDLRVLAARAHVPVTLLQELNPALVHGITPPSGHAHLRVPKGSLATVASALERIPPNQRLVMVTHAVHAGDTLGGIAWRFGTDVATLRAANRLSGTFLRTGQRIIVPTLGLRPTVTLAASHGAPTGDRRSMRRGRANPPRLRHGPRSMATPQPHGVFTKGGYAKRAR